MAAGETYIVYGDMQLWNCLTSSGGFSQEPVFDESGTDLLYYKFTIRVLGTITNLLTSQANLGANPVAGNTAGVRHAGMQYTIAPRKHFEYHTGAVVDGLGSISNPGSTVVICDPIINPSQISNLAGFDLNSGPRCTAFNIVQVVADNLFRVEAEFEICMLTCNIVQQVTQTAGILNNRWAVQDVVDIDRMTTRTITGRMRLASSVLNPNQFRNWVIPGLQPGMTRTGLEVTVTPDALNLLYTITDKEIAYSAPAPATSWDFEHTESATRENGLSKYGEVRVTLRGDRNVDHKKLISLATAIAEAKLVSGAANNQCLIMENTVVDRYGDNQNSVSLTVRGQRFPVDGEALLGLPTKLLGKPITAADINEITTGYDSRLSRGARTGEQIEVSGPIPIAAAFAAYLQSPCSDTHMMSQVVASNTSPVPNPTPPANISVSTSNDIADDSSNSYFNNAANQSIYTYYKMESSYEGAGMRTHAPIALTGGSSGGDPYAASGSQQTSVVVNLSARLTKRRVRIRGERVGKSPDMPLMGSSFIDPNGITYTLLDTIDHPTQPDRTPDAKRLFQLDREYVYALSRAPNAADTIVVGVNPWENLGQTTRAYDPGILESAYPIS